MIEQNKFLLLLFMSIVVAMFGLCLSKPTTSPDVLDSNDIESKTLQTAVMINEVVHIVDDNKASNTIFSEDSDYRSNYAMKMLSYMNQSVHPCDDFYEYACGNWKNVIEDRQTQIKRNNILEIAYKLADNIENLLQRSHIDDVSPEYAYHFELAKKFYNKCLEAELYPMHKSPDYLEVLNKIGGFPAVNSSWNSKNFSWLNMSAHMSNYGAKNLVNEAILPEYPYPPYFKVPDFGFDIELHHDTIENTSSNAYKENEKRIINILTTYGVEESRINSIVKDIFSFLTEILQVTKQFNEDAYECKFLSFLMEESKVQAVREQWHTYYEIAWMGKENFSENFEECCTPCAYLYEKVNSICEQHKEAAANYLSLKFLYHMDARIEDNKFQKDFCISNIKSSMVYFFDHLYIKLYFNDELRKEITGLVKEIRQSLHIALQEADWLDEKTRKAALLKESTLVEYIGRYEDQNITKQLIAEMKTLEFVDGSYEANNLNLQKFKQHMKRFSGLHHEKLSNKTKPLELLIGMQVNSFYYNIDNSIYVMAGTLLPPIYDKTWPNSLKFGTLGYLIGHEFTHGFDSVGASYDEAGNNNFWWSTKSSKVFKERSNCFVNHYQKYLIPELNRTVNGNLTKDENIADGGGLRKALQAYRRYMKNITKNLDSTATLYKEEQMPGLELSPEQLFFLGFAQLWCSSYKEADYWEELGNEHTIDRYRVLGALSNNADFAKAYNCPLGSEMNPSADKCEMW